MFTSDAKNKLSPAVLQKGTSNNFFRKKGEEAFFGMAKQTPFFESSIQTKLTVSTPDDPQEREADAVANKVMTMPEPVSAFSNTKEKEEKLQKKEKEEIQTKEDLSPNNKMYHKEAQEKVQTKQNTCDGNGKENYSIQKADEGKKMGRVNLVPEAASPQNNGTFHQESTNVMGAGQGHGHPAPLAAGTCPSNITFSTGNHPVHVPLCGITSVTANTVPANIPGVTWTLAAGTATIAAGTAISSTGDITFGSSQTGGTITVTADQPSATGGGTCSVNRDLPLHSHPTAINSTFTVGPPANAAQNYGAVFDHNFTSADGTTASLNNVAVGEEFIGVPNPTGTTHVIPGTPFGNFTLNTANLTANATNNWFLNNSSLGGNHDTVTIGRAGINVGRFLRSASNPSPTTTLPASFTVVQGLHWFCRQAAPGSRWTRFITVNHVRTLRLDSSGTGVEFVVSVNGQENVNTYTGQPAIINARAASATIPITPPRQRGRPAPTPSGTIITADSRPDPLLRGHALRFSIQGSALGCTVNATTGEFRAGSQTGSVTVRVRDSAAANSNFDEVTITIVSPPQPAPAPAGGPTGSPQTSPNATTGSTP